MVYLISSIMSFAYNEIKENIKEMMYYIDFNNPDYNLQLLNYKDKKNFIDNSLFDYITINKSKYSSNIQNLINSIYLIKNLYLFIDLILIIFNIFLTRLFLLKNSSISKILI